MKVYFIPAFLIVTFLSPSIAQKIPEGYLLQYQQNFNGSKALFEFEFNDPGSWGIFNTSGNFYLQCNPYDSVSTLPARIAIISDKIFGDFILEADFMPIADTSDYKEFCIFLGMKDYTKYYYSKITNKEDIGFFIVKNSASLKINNDTIAPYNFKDNKWHKVRLERNIVRRTIIIYIDNMNNPYMQIRNYELVMGSIGFGTNSNSARFDNIKIWAPTVMSEEESKQ